MTLTESQREAWETLRQVWDEFPEQRLCQLIVNAVGPDPFYATDERLAEALREFLSAQTLRARVGKRK